MFLRKKLEKISPDTAVLDPTEERFQKMVDIVWDLDKKNFNRMMEALKLVWQGYDKIRTVQTTEEQEAITNDDGLGEFLDVEPGGEDAREK